MTFQKLIIQLVLCLVFLCLSWVTAWAQESDTIAPLPIKLPRPSFTGTPLNYRGPFLEPPTLRKRAPFLAPVGTKNVAFGKPVTASIDESLTGSLNMIVDGEKGFEERFQVDLMYGPQWVQIDLGAEHEVYGIIVWHYHATDRVYFDVVVRTSLEEGWSKGVRTHYNNDRDNSSGLGAGKDNEYIEDFQGRLIDTKGTPARFVRLHTNGNTSNDSNHYIEVEVWGRPVAAPAAPAYKAGGVEDKGYVISDEDRAKIMSALPDQSPATPKQPRRLLIFDLNVVYGGHKSRFYANLAFQEMGKKTGAFETVITRDPNVFKKENLAAFDAVFFNNTVGNQFTDPQLRQNLIEFIYGGGGFMGSHGTTCAFFRWGEKEREDWPEFGLMLGGRGASHRSMQEQVVMKVDSPGHPLMAPFPAEGFELIDEFFRPRDTYSRDRLRVLFSIDIEKTDLSGKPHEREDKDYAIAWVRHYGRGRVFYSTVGHNPYQFWDPTILKFYLGAAQFALGDLPAPTIPSGRLTPAIAAQEKLGWPLGITAYTFNRYTLFETIEKTDQVGLAYLGGLSFQKVSQEINKNFDARLSDEELKAIRLKLDAAGVRMLTFFYSKIPGDEQGCHKVFEFARKMGIETFISEPPLDALDTIERFCDEYDINLAIHNHGPKQSPNYWSPEAVMKVCQGCGPRIGVCADIGYWMRAGIDPVAAVKTIGQRLLVVQMHDLNELTTEGHDVPWGTGVGRTEEFLREIHRQGIRPKMFGLEYSYDWEDSMPEVTQSARFFDKVTLGLAK